MRKELEQLERNLALRKIRFWHDVGKMCLGATLYVIMFHLLHMKGEITPIAFDGILYAAVSLGSHQYRDYLKRKLEESNDKTKR